MAPQGQRQAVRAASLMAQHVKSAFDQADHFGAIAGARPFASELQFGDRVFGRDRRLDDDLSIQGRKAVIIVQGLEVVPVPEQPRSMDREFAQGWHGRSIADDLPRVCGLVGQAKRRLGIKILLR